MALSKKAVAQAGGVKAPEIINKDDTNYRIKLINWLNFANSCYDGKDAIKFFTSWGEKAGMVGEIDPSRVVPTMGWVAFAIEAGNELVDDDVLRLMDHWESIRIDQKPVQPKPVKKEVDPLQVMDKVDYITDEFIKNRDRVPEVTVEVFSGCVKKDVELYREYIKGFLSICQNADSEEYGWSEVQIRNGKALVKRLLASLDQWNDEFKLRKPRKVRKSKVNVEKKLANLKLDPKSRIDGSEILGAKRVVFWDGNYNQIRIYESDEGLDIKGTSLYNITASKAKRIRPNKRDEMIKAFSGNAQKRAEKLFGSTNAKEVVPTKQTNDQMVILKVTK